MGKKKDNDRVVIEGPSAPKSKKKTVPEINFDECLIIHNAPRKKKIMAEFPLPEFMQNGPQNITRKFIALNYDHDKKTPAFLYENQKRQQLKYQLEYQNRLKHAKDPMDEVFKVPPEPREKKNRRNYCAICVKSYSKYKSHILHNEHVTKMNENDFTKNLKKIEAFYIDKKQRRSKSKNKKA